MNNCPCWRFVLVGVILNLSLLTTACQQEMARQPSFRPLEPSEFFKDGRASRQLVEGTVPWNGGRTADASLTASRQNRQTAFGLDLGPVDYVDTCPIEIDRKALERGRDRFNIYCAMCHDELGTGNGKIVERGYLQPPNYHLDDSRAFRRRGWTVPLREVPVGYFFEVITRGYGGMPDYAEQIPAADRWKIVAWVRVLQRSQYVSLKDLPADRQQSIRAELRSVEEAK